MQREKLLSLISDWAKLVVSVLRYLLIALPIISLALNAISWLRFGVDMPYMDDWRQYLSGGMGRLDFAYLMTPANDTLYSVGLLLDSLAFRFLDGNTIAYQFLSLVGVLGTLLVLQWRLLSLCITNPLIKACAFSLTVLMLQPDTYWGWQNMAFHQAIPLICVLASLNIMLGERWKASWAIPSFIILGLVSGFSYTSGAFAILGLSFAVLLAQCFMVGPRKKRLLMAGLSLVGPALLSTAAQVWVIVGVQHGTHRPDAPMAYPWESDFWLYLLGKIARSLMLPIDQPGLSLLITLVMVSLVVGACLIVASRLIRRQISSQGADFFVVFFSLIVVIALYLLLVAAGRTNLRPVHLQAPLDVFAFGFHRFHFFWVTLLWPWLAAVALTLILRPGVGKVLTSLIFTIFTATLLLGIKNTHIFEHEAFYRKTLKVRLDGVNCIQSQFQAAGSINCPQLHPNVDLSKAFTNARQVDASFTRSFSFIPLPLGANAQAPLFRMSEHLGDVRLFNVERQADPLNLLKIMAGIDPMLVISTGKTELMRNCRVLEVNVRVDAHGPDSAQLFYLLPGKASFSAADSRTAGIGSGRNTQTISFAIRSEIGFADQVRFDPVTKPQTLTINELEIRCRAFVTP